MGARLIPIEWPRAVEVWHDACADRRADPRADRLIAVRDDGADAGWPAPILGIAERKQ